MSAYKVGDRVRFIGSAVSLPDTGTVETIEKEYIWVRWDSDNSSQFFLEEDAEKFPKITQDQEITRDIVKKVLLAHAIAYGNPMSSVSEGLVNTVFSTLEKDQADYQLYLKLKSRFEGEQS